MSQVVEYALARLVSLLPLPARQATLSPDLKRAHRAFLRSMVERGRPLTSAELEAAAPGHDALTALWTLVSLDLVVLGRDGRPVGAYPVTIEPTPHRVTVNGNTLWAMCALDAVAVAPMFGTTTAIRSRCPVTGAEIAISMQDSRILDLSPGKDVQIGVWWRDPGPVAARNFCPGIMFLRDRAAAAQWQAGQSSDHDVAPLADAVEVGARFFKPLVEDAPVAVSR